MSGIEYKGQTGRAQAAFLLDTITGESDPVADFRVIAESPERKANVAKRLKSGAGVRFNYRGRLSELFDTLDAKNRAGSAVFYVANETDGNGRRLANMTAARMLALDLDGEPLPKRWKIAPHIITESSPGKFQCVWAIEKTTDFAAHRDVMLRLAHRFGGDRSVADITRVLRLPGFLHAKKKPFRSRIIRNADPAVIEFDRLPLSAFDWLPKLPQPQRKSTHVHTGGTVSCELAAEYLEHLPAEEFGRGNYDAWLRVGMALHFATGGAALDEWLAWCATDPEFDNADAQEVAATKWDSFGLDRESAVTIGTLIYFGEAYDVPSRILGRMKFGPISAAEDFADDLDLVEA